MRYFFLVLLVAFSAWAQDLDQPAGPNDYRSGFFGADYRGYSQQTWEHWADPGNEFCKVLIGSNCDGSTAHGVAEAISTWQNMSQCNRWRVRLFHHAMIKKVHITQPRIWAFYHTGIPASKKTAIKDCLKPSEFEYLGDTYSDACSTLNDHSAGLCDKFWTQGKMDTVVYGWESDSQ